MGDTFLRRLKAFFFDLDGCIYHGDVLSPGAKELLQQLRMEDKLTCFVTNNSRQTSSEIAERLVKLGLDVIPREIITATDYVGLYVREKYGIVKVKAAGSIGLQRSLEHMGHKVIPLDSSETSDVVVVGRDTEFNYDKLQWIVNEVERGARVVGTNPDMYHPGSRGERIPETGALTAAIELIVGKEVEYVGKPAPYLFRYGMERYGVESGECVMVGDNFETDIIGGIRSGMKTIWLAGEGLKPPCYRYDEANRWVPDYIVNNIEGIRRLFAEHIRCTG